MEWLIILVVSVFADFASVDQGAPACEFARDSFTHEISCEPVQSVIDVSGLQHPDRRRWEQ